MEKKDWNLEDLKNLNFRDIYFKGLNNSKTKKAIKREWEQEESHF